MSHENDAGYREDRERYWKEQEQREKEQKRILKKRKKLGILTLDEIKNLKEVRQSDQQSIKRFFESGGFDRPNLCCCILPALIWDDGLLCYIHNDYYTLGTVDSAFAKIVCKDKIQVAIKKVLDTYE